METKEMRNDHTNFKKGVTQFVRTQNTDMVIHIIQELERRVHELELKMNER